MGNKKMAGRWPWRTNRSCGVTASLPISELRFLRSLIRDCARQIVANHSRADGGIGQRIHQNETAGGAAVFVRIKEQRAAGFEFQDGDAIHGSSCAGS